MVHNPTPGCFYFIADQFYKGFGGAGLMSNNSPSGGQSHRRPCFYSFQDMKTGLYWVIPISSRVAKYRQVAESKIRKHGRCDTILFGKVLGYEKAFLIQNMFPVSPTYFDSQYMDAKTNAPVRVDGAFEKKLIKSAKRILALVHNGAPYLIFSDVLSMEKQLLGQRSLS